MYAVCTHFFFVCVLLCALCLFRLLILRHRCLVFRYLADRRQLRETELVRNPCRVAIRYPTYETDEVRQMINETEDRDSLDPFKWMFRGIWFDRLLTRDGQHFKDAVTAVVLYHVTPDPLKRWLAWTD
jgi:hypothetical protein